MKFHPAGKLGNVFHLSFEIALLIKAFDAAVEVICGAILIFLNPSTANRLIVLLTSEELSEDPKDLVANALIRFGHNFSVSAQHFGVFYLSSHGLLKLVLVYLLWKRKIWAYPAAVVLLCLFVVYQIYKLSLTFSLLMIFITVLDLVVIILTAIEYRKQKKLFQ